MDDMRGDMQTLRGDMQTQRGEMQSMGLNLQAGQKAIRAIARGEMRTMDYKMAAPRGGTSEPWGSVTAVWPAMDTGKVGTSDVIIVGETCRVRHEETTEEPKEVTETEKLTETQRETQDLEIMTKTQEAKEGNKLNKVKNEHTQVGIVGSRVSILILAHFSPCK